MMEVPKLHVGYRDAENYKRRENKELFNRIFIRTDALERLCEQSTFFLVGEKGTGKTAYAIYLANNNYKMTSASIRYIRETEYQKFVELKRSRQLTLSDYTNIWKVIIFLLLAEQIGKGENANPQWGKSAKYANLKAAIDEYYKNAFSPEIIYAIRFAEEAETTARILSRHDRLAGQEARSISFDRSEFQTNLFYIQRQFEGALRSLKLVQNHILFIDGIDIRPGTIPYPEYSECIKGLANAVWSINNDFLSSIRDSRGRLRVVLLMRPDIFDSLSLQNQNSKLRDNAVVLNWLTTYTEYRESPLFLMADRLLAFQQAETLDFGRTWDHYFPFDAPSVISEQRDPSSFISFLRYSFYRPRDIIGMLSILKENFIQQQRKPTTVFKINDFTDPMFTRKYSDYLLGEVKDHLSFYYPADDWEKFMRFFHYFNGQWSFTYEEYLVSYQEFVDFLVRNHETTPTFAATADLLLQFLYDLNILCYVAESEDHPFFGWCFKERSATNLAPKVKTRAKYEIHFGLRKALDLGKKLRRR
jgi:hypothetical protein